MVGLKRSTDNFLYDCLHHREMEIHLKNFKDNSYAVMIRLDEISSVVDRTELVVDQRHAENCFRNSLVFIDLLGHRVM